MIGRRLAELTVRKALLSAALLAAALVQPVQGQTWVEVVNPCGSRDYSRDVGSNESLTQNIFGQLCIYDPGGGAGGGAVTIADGADVTLGMTTDDPWSGSGAATLIAVEKKIESLLAAPLSVSWADAQPVIVTSLPHITIDSLPGIVFASPQPVIESGTWSVGITNWPATQPVSIASMPSTPVTGTFWQSIQPVSGTVAVSNFPATQQVSGTFWQATQPVSGTFWQATQPISAVSLPLPTGAALDATVSAFESANHTDLAGIKTSLGSPFQAGGSIGNTAFTANAGTNLNTSALDLESTQSAFKAASHTDLAAILTGLGTPMQNSGGSVTANAGTNLNTSALALDATLSAFKTANHADLGTINTTLGLPLQAGGTVSAKPIDSAAADLTAAKGSQTSRFMGVQSAHDAGRTYVSLTYDRVTGITSEALATITINKGGTTSSGTSYTVTSGKTLRLTSIYCEVLDTTTVGNRTIVRVRAAASSITASSAIIAMCSGAAPGATATMIGSGVVPLPDGIELAAGTQVGISHLENVTTASIASATLSGYEY